MLPLDDLRWLDLIGGYQVRYDASEAIERLLNDSDKSAALVELENELCHQGDLGSAAYAAVPWIVEHIRRRTDLDARAVGLVLTIEFGRPFQRDPLPVELQGWYHAAIRQLPDIVLSKRGAPWDDLQVQVAASVLALAAGNVWFARTYYELDRVQLQHMLNDEFGSDEWGWP
jgi:hypothetical protein